MADGTNSRSHYNILGPSKGGVAAGRPTLLDLASSEGLVSAAHLFGVSSAFFCKHQSTGLAGNTVSLWNGEDSDNTVGGTWTNGECRIIPNPPLPSDNTLTNIIPIITPMFGHVSGDYPVIDVLGASSTPAVNKYTSIITITWKDSGDAVIAARQIWFMVMLISPRKCADTAAYPASNEWAKSALHGGVIVGTEFEQ